MRATGITDSYGKQYRRHNDGSLRRVKDSTPVKPLVLEGYEL